VPSFPDLPPVGDTVPGFEASLGYGLLVPAGTPQAVVSKINRDVNVVLRDPAYAGRLAGEGMTIEGGTPEQFRDFLAAERTKWSALLKRLDLKLD
jgi:tripartite-type tricarboxylate transporter receptor subunit TctC